MPDSRIGDREEGRAHEVDRTPVIPTPAPTSTTLRHESVHHEFVIFDISGRDSPLLDHLSPDRRRSRLHPHVPPVEQHVSGNGDLMAFVSKILYIYG
ncbi:MAG: hypothetical protein QOF33_2837 [Thermomicrobiales bacterium]|jgi:hypothetical protein|nr:hypothetical protein [Thermomicrobiales bacterium]